eukprot:7897501-Lingulodinium_polyedra.AAC.1
MAASVSQLASTGQLVPHSLVPVANAARDSLYVASVSHCRSLLGPRLPFRPDAREACANSAINVRRRLRRL